MKDAVLKAKDLVMKRVFNWDRTLMAEISGVKMLTALLNDFVTAAARPTQGVNRKFIEMIGIYPASGSADEKLHSITDFISGMTDSYLLRTFRQLNGHTLLT